MSNKLWLYSYNHIPLSKFCGAFKREGLVDGLGILLFRDHEYEIEGCLQITKHTHPMCLFDSSVIVLRNVLNS